MIESVHGLPSMLIDSIDSSARKMSPFLRRASISTSCSAQGCADIFDRDRGAILAPEQLVIHTPHQAIADRSVDGTLYLRIWRAVRAGMMDHVVNRLARQLRQVIAEQPRCCRVNKGHLVR